MIAAPHPGNSHLQVSLNHLTLHLAREPLFEYLLSNPPAQFFCTSELPFSDSTQGLDELFMR